MNILNTICSMETSDDASNFENLRLAIKLANELRDRINIDANDLLAMESLSKEVGDHASIRKFEAMWVNLSRILKMESNNENT